MRFKNYSTAELLVDPEDGKGGLVSIKAGAYFDGCSKYINDFLISQGLRLVPDGTPIGPYVMSESPLVFTIGKNIKINSLLPDADAIAYFSDVSLDAEQTYTLWGRISWNDGTSDFTRDFTVIGNGTHDDGATFEFGGSGSADTEPAASIPILGDKGEEIGTVDASIDVKSGSLSIPFTDGPAVGPVTIELVYDYYPVAESGYYGLQSNFLLDGATISERLVYIGASEDDTVDYVASSAGQIKYSRKYLTGSVPGDPCRVKSYYYRDASNPTKPTHILDTIETVTLDDLV